MKNYFFFALSLLLFTCSLPAQKLDTLPVPSYFNISNRLPYHFRAAGTAVMDNDSLKSNPPTNIKQATWNAVWLKFTIKSAGTLTFVIVPDFPEDDIDFTLFQKKEKHTFFGKYKRVRDMQAGDFPNVKNSPCMGPTGLRAGEVDVEAEAVVWNGETILGSNP